MAEPKIAINLWFADEAEAAAKFYTSLFPNSRITAVAHYPEAGNELVGSVMTVAFELDDQPFMALNGSLADCSTNESISLLVKCDTQAEIDSFWTSVTADNSTPVESGWLKDKYGISWQTAPPVLDQLRSDPAPLQSTRTTTALLIMKK